MPHSSPARSRTCSATPEAHGGGVKGLIVRDAEGGVAFEVNDAGPGFVPGDEAKVFESFYRPKNGAQAPTEKGSLGLGLTLVKRIAVAHGGTAFAENREEGGARVGIVIPARERQLARAQRPPSGHAHARAPAPPAHALFGSGSGRRLTPAETVARYLSAMSTRRSRRHVLSS